MPHPRRHGAHGHPRHAHGARGPGGMPLDFDRAPFLVIWETTQACDLACKHCRAEAQPNRHPGELTTAEARRMLDDVRRFGPIIFVFSGGDALKRPDIVELTRYGSELGLRMAITPATTPLCTEERLRELHEAGIARLAVSLDGPTAAIHDEFRRVEGSFDHGLRILRAARRAQEGSYFAILGVGAHASDREIESARRRASSELLGIDLAFLGLENLEDARREALVAIEEAAAVLANQRLRDAYARALERPPLR